MIKYDHSSISPIGAITRNMPYQDSHKIINVSTGQDVTGGTVPSGTPLRIDVKVKNPGTLSEKVKARLVFDRDEVPTFDLDLPSTESTVAAKSGLSDGEVIISFLLTPTLAGNYFGTVGTMTNVNGTDFTCTDGTAWGTTKWLTVTPAVLTGDLSITVNNLSGYSTAFPGINGIVRLYDSKDGFVEEGKTNQNGIASFSGIPVGSGYYYKVFHNPPNISAPFGVEYWGMKSDVTISANQISYSIFTRNQPYGGQVKVFNGTNDVTGQTVAPGTKLTIEYTLNNPSSISQSVKSKIYIDQSKSYPFDFTLQGTLQTIAPNGNIKQTMTLTPTVEGSYFNVGALDVSAGSTPLFTDGGVWQQDPIFKVSAPSGTFTLLGAMANRANSYSVNTIGDGKALYNLYNDKLHPKKVYGLLSKGVGEGFNVGVEVYVDLDDYYSAMMMPNHPENIITQEGSKGWVTIWVNGKVGFGFDVPIPLPFSFGITTPEDFTPPQYDPKKEWEFSALTFELPFFKTSLFNTGETGTTWGIMELPNDGYYGSQASYSFVDFGLNIFRFEIQKTTLDKLVDDAFLAGLAAGNMEKSAIIKSTGAFVTSLIDIDGERIIPKRSFTVNDIRNFTSSDNNVDIGVDGTIDFLNGGIDINGDGIRDNYYPVVPETFFHLPVYEHKAELTFQNTGKEPADFSIKVKDVPSGWFVGADDGGFYSPLNDDEFVVSNVNPSIGKNSVSTSWAIACLANAPEEAVVTFELWQRSSPFHLLQSKVIKLHKYHDINDKNVRPTFTPIEPSFPAFLAPDQDLTISWDDSDPDDNATIALAIDPDLNDTPWVGVQNHIWIARDIKEDPDGIGDTFVWNAKGTPPGKYSLWAVIYDGKNDPLYVKYPNAITIASQGDFVSPVGIINVSTMNKWFNSNPPQDISFSDNIGLDNMVYHIFPKSNSQKAAKADIITDWHPLTSNGMFILPESQNCLSDKLTTPWKISNADWDNLVANTQNGEKYYLYLKATDDAGNKFVTPDDASALELKIDTQIPHIAVNLPLDGQKFEVKSVEVSWVADDITNGILLSGLQNIFIALDQSEDFIQLPADAVNYTFNNLSDGVHSVYMKAKDNAGNFSELNRTNFSVNADILIPSLYSSGISNITSNSASAGGGITDDNGVGILAKGICWSLDSNPTTALTSKTNEGTGLGVFSSNLTDLVSGQTYHVRAYATNCAGTAYSEDLQFTTNNGAVLPSLLTNNVSDIGLTSASSGGYVTSDGEAQITNRGICWGTSINPSIDLSTKTTDGTDIGTFTSTISGLVPGTIYHVRAFATNSVGTNYGADVSFKTYMMQAPVANDATNIVQTSCNISWNNMTTATGYRLDIALDNSFTSFLTDYNNKDIGNVTSFNVTGLNANTTYYYQIRAYNTNGESPNSNAITITTLPNPPDAPLVNTATNIIQTSCTANWSSLTTATGYRLDIATDNAFATFVTGYNNKDVGNVTSLSVTGLSANTSYYYRIRAYNTGGVGNNSTTIKLTTLPNPPSATTTTTATSIVQTSCTANWNSSATATGYKLDVATDNGFTAIVTGYNNKDVGNITSSSVTGLSANTTYYYRVRAYNTGGDSPNSNTITVTTLPNPPSAPTTNAATNIVQTSCTANWGSSSTATGYKLDVATDNGFTAIVTGYNNKDIGNVTSSSVTGLSANTIYYYRVRAYNTGGNSPNSNTITLTTLPNPPVAPVANAATSVVQTSSTANWSSSATATGYKLDVATDNGFTAIVTGYNNKDIGNVTSSSVSGLTANTTYYYRVRAYNMGGDSPNSNIITVTTLPNPPSATTANTATNIVQTSCTANWNSSTTATGYKLDVATDNGFTALVNGYNSKDIGNVTSSSVTGLSANTTYYYHVRAYNTGGDSPNSNTITLTTLPNPPSAPTANTANSIVQTSFTASWNSSNTATGYRIDIATNSSFTTYLGGYNDKDVSNVLNVNVTGLSAKTSYYYRVRAYNTGGTSSSSSTVTTTTLTNPPDAPLSLTSSSCNDLITLKWQKSTGPDVTRYRIYGNTTTNPSIKIDSTTSSASEIVKNIPGLTRGQVYYFRVTAVNYDGPESVFSSQVSEKVKMGVVPIIKAKFGDLLICPNVGDSIVSYQWFKNNVAISNATSQNYVTNKQPGAYMVQTTDRNGCINISNVVTITGSKSLSIYPNPTSGTFALKINDVTEGRAYITIINSSGIKVKELQAESPNDDLLKEISVRNLTPGVYIVKVLLDNEELYYTKIVVTK